MIISLGTTGVTFSFNYSTTSYLYIIIKYNFAKLLMYGVVRVD